jgi:hypothetical protein
MHRQAQSIGRFRAMQVNGVMLDGLARPIIAHLQSTAGRSFPRQMRRQGRSLGRFGAILVDGIKFDGLTRPIIAHLQ